MSDRSKVAIFPATSALGTSLTKHLLKLINPERLLLITRYPEKIPKEYTAKGVQVRQASFEDSPQHFYDIFQGAGVDVLFLVSYPTFRDEIRIEAHTRVIQAAHRAAVEHVFYSSLAYAGDLKDESVALVMRAHLATERLLKQMSAEDRSFTYTSIRMGLYAESYPIYTAFFDPKNPTEEIAIPHDGSAPGIAWAKRDELGEASAKLVARYLSNAKAFPLLNETVLLTGPRAWTLSETVDALAKLAGRKEGEVRIREVTVDEFVRQPRVLEHFGSEEMGRGWATAWDAIRAGETCVVSPTLEELLGRPPESFDVAIRE